MDAKSLQQRDKECLQVFLRAARALPGMRSTRALAWRICRGVADGIVFEVNLLNDHIGMAIPWRSLSEVARRRLDQGSRGVSLKERSSKASSSSGISRNTGRSVLGRRV